MQEELTTLKTFKLAKEKGFNVETCCCGGFPECICEDKMPTQSLLRRWLREVHNIHFIEKIFFDASINVITYICDPIDVKNNQSKRLLPRDSYEAALEAGLLEALKSINC